MHLSLGAVVLLALIAGCANPSVIPSSEPADSSINASSATTGTPDRYSTPPHNSFLTSSMSPPGHCAAYSASLEWNDPFLGAASLRNAAQTARLNVSTNPTPPKLPLKAWRPQAGNFSLVEVRDYRGLPPEYPEGLPVYGALRWVDDPYPLLGTNESHILVRLHGQWGPLRSFGPQFLDNISSAPLEERQRWMEVANPYQQNLSEGQPWWGDHFVPDRLELDLLWGTLFFQSPRTAHELGKAEMVAETWTFSFLFETVTVTTLPPHEYTFVMDSNGFARVTANETRPGPDPLAKADIASALANLGLSPRFEKAQDSLRCVSWLPG